MSDDRDPAVMAAWQKLVTCLDRKFPTDSPMWDLWHAFEEAVRADERRAAPAAAPGAAAPAPPGELMTRLVDSIGDDAEDALLRAPCAFCGYNGPNYWQSGTHASVCPWSAVGGEVDRANKLKTVLFTALAGAPGREITPRCSFCGRAKHNGVRLIEGGPASSRLIACEACVADFNDLLRPGAPGRATRDYEFVPDSYGGHLVTPYGDKWYPEGKGPGRAAPTHGPYQGPELEQAATDVVVSYVLGDFGNIVMPNAIKALERLRAALRPAPPTEAK